jgi:hypothetical protein
MHICELLGALVGAITYNNFPLMLVLVARY